MGLQDFRKITARFKASDLRVRALWANFHTRNEPSQRREFSEMVQQGLTEAKPLDKAKGPNRFEPFWFLGVGYRLRCEAVERSAMMCRALSASCLAWGSKSSALRTSGSLSACALRPSS